MRQSGKYVPAVRSQLHIVPAVLTCLMLNIWAARAEAWVLSNERTHLRSGSVTEWEEFATSPAGRRFDHHFTAQPNPAEVTLFIRKDDVRQDWLVELNGQRLGQLFLMEADLVHTLAIPARTLKAGENVLSIVPPRENDDIVLLDLQIEPRPVKDALL